MLSSMKYQLVLQFEATGIEDFDGLIVLEEILITTLPRKCRVDGHDFGMGEFNIFILTDDPESAFGDVRKVLQDNGRPGKYQAAFRELKSDEYIILWPPTLERFTIT